MYVLNNLYDVNDAFLEDSQPWSRLVFSNYNVVDWTNYISSVEVHFVYFRLQITFF